MYHKIMNYHTSINVSIPKSALMSNEGVVVLPMKKWREIEDDLENSQMYLSENLAKEIAERRKDKKTVPLDVLLKKHKI